MCHVHNIDFSLNLPLNISLIFNANKCSDRPFCVVILEGYGVAGMYIVVLGHSDRMFGCLGNLVMCLPPRRWRQATPRGGEVSLSRALKRA